MVYALEVIRNCIRVSYMYMYVIYVVFIKITKMYKKLFDIKTTNFRICANIKNAFSFVSHYSHNLKLCFIPNSNNIPFGL